MSKGLKALKSLEKIVSKLYGMDMAYDVKTFTLFYTIGKELQALEILKRHFIKIRTNNMSEDDFNLLKEVFK